MHDPDLYCVIGHPVAHSRSPWIHARFAELTGQAMRYERCLAPLDGFAARLAAERARGLRGCNVPVPFKHEAAALADVKSAAVELAGAANTLRFTDDGRILADNTDGAGLVADLTRNAGVALAGCDLLLLGAGGAAAGVLAPLLRERPRRLVLANRTLARAEELVARHPSLAAAAGTDLLACALDDTRLRAGFDVLVNATASSLAGDAVPVTAAALRPGALALDMMYGAAAHGFLHWATQHGARARDGLGMLVEQAAEAFQLWRGVRPPSAQVLAELRAVVDAEAAH
ncbi:shikimate dehydrogenase [Tibeticola sp.]|uniref:shikimate dehydrogenase n=1 Tax=Tibeticola sp. TaxID=2005368 RepID=UPI0025FA60F4|nr:shikimate dehydrogenase [Tibeticola sp.]